MGLGLYISWQVSLKVWKLSFILMVYGDSPMTKPDFSQMSRQELRKYVLVKREDDDAIEALINRTDLNSPSYPYPRTDEEFRQMEEIFRKRLGQNRDSA